MTPGFERPPNFESGSQESKSEELLGITIEDCSLESPSDEIETGWSIKQCEELRDQCLRQAEAEVDGEADPEKIRVKKVSVLQENINHAAERNMKAKPGSVEQKITFHTLQVLGEKQEELLPDKESGPKNMRLYSQSSQRNKKMPTTK